MAILKVVVAVSVIIDSVATVPGNWIAGGLANFLLTLLVSGSPSDATHTGFGLENKIKHSKQLKEFQI